MAEEKNVVGPKPVNFAYVWGDTRGHLERVAPDLRIINLETSITVSEDYWKEKQINYRMNPKNTPCLTAAKIDCCSLANNHVLDWGYSGLEETLETLRNADIKTSGAGINIEQTESPAVIEVSGKGRIVFFAFGLQSSGVPANWAAKRNKIRHKFARRLIKSRGIFT